jgi:hypothetical protein
MGKRARGVGCADAVMIAGCRLLPSVAGGRVSLVVGSLALTPSDQIILGGMILALLLL